MYVVASANLPCDEHDGNDLGEADSFGRCYCGGFERSVHVHVLPEGEHHMSAFASRPPGAIEYRAANCWTP